MVLSRTCSFRKQNGEPCRNAPMQDDDQCFWHSPAHADEAAAARKLGGSHRRKERTLAGVYGIDGVTSITELQRIIEVVILEGLALENGVARLRVIVSAVVAAAKLLEHGEHEERLQAIEALLRPRIMRERRG
jgi:hypothetical protein